MPVPVKLLVETANDAETSGVMAEFTAFHPCCPGCLIYVKTRLGWRADTCAVPMVEYALNDNGLNHRYLASVSTAGTRRGCGEAPRTESGRTETRPGEAPQQRKASNAAGYQE
ncbi:MAG: hypothetical protein D4R74_00295 [Betaproteobacteria bacterium]|nr:MAG: hypothetical protein D4R74_00295 [Betaproteobacteria bacterium]